MLKHPINNANAELNQMILKTSRFNIFAVSIACSLILSGCIATDRLAQPKRVVVFGDSNVDTGNLAKLFGDIDPRKNVWNGRNSNGPLVTESFQHGNRTNFINSKLVQCKLI
ncbi:MAG: hypothetical protein ACI9WC_000261 [Arenicella sp.]|jgi:hypothetical protein